LVDGEDVSGGDCGFSSAEDVLSGIGAFSGEEVLGLFFVFIWVSEVDLDEGAASSGVVEYSADDSSDVSLSF
jgi:hypothetical protein